MLHAHVLEIHESEMFPELQAALADQVKLTWGDVDDGVGAYDVLVAGYPTVDTLRHSDRLHTVIIPWAGLPVPSREVLLDFPHLDVRNLHHNASSVAETAVGLMIAVARQILPYDRRMRQHDWGELFPPRYDGLHLGGKTALLLGYGAIAKHIGRVCLAMGMNVLATRRSQPDASHVQGVSVHHTSQLHELLPQSQVLFVCTPLTPETQGMIGAEQLAMLPPRAVLINIARGEIVDEDALFSALSNGQLYGAGLDVWYQYPKGKSLEARQHAPPSRHPFHELDNVIMNPHRADHCDENERLRMIHLAESLRCAARGEPIPHPVDVQRGY